ncbi:MAG: Omp28 family outer membrane lipoprotein [Bacteroidia bacterium]
MKQTIQKSSVILILAIFSIAIISCDKISPPYTQEIATVVTKRKVLLEDYTGHTCPNCPNAAKEADTIANYLYKDQVVVMALHVGGFATPYPGAFYYDFRTTEGTELDNFFALATSGLPKGMINRAGFPALTHKKAYSTWANNVFTELSKPVEAAIEISNTYNQSTNTVITTVNSKFVEDLSGKYFLSVFYVEDSIIQPQSTNGGGTISDYVHMHVLRGSFNGTWGEQIALDPQKDSEVSKTYATPLKTDAVPKNCRVVAFIYNFDTKEVVQADEKQIQ